MNQRILSTKVNTIESMFTWNVINFSVTGKKTGEKIISPDFTMDGNNKIVWQINIYPRGLDNLCADHVSIFLFLKESEEIFLETQLSFFIIDTKGRYLHKQNEIFFFKKGSGFGWNKFIPRNLLLNSKNMLVNDKVTIGLTVRVGVDIVNIPSSIELSNQLLDSNCLSNDLIRCMRNGSHSDVTIKVDKKTISAHKAILAARSSVFAATFQHDMKEKNDGVLEIEDFKYEVVQELLHYIYSGRVQKLETLTVDLLRISDKYAVEPLKTKCEEYLIEHIDLKNAVDMLANADICQAQKLKVATMDFIIYNAKSIVNTPAFKILENTYPPLIIEMFKQLVNK